MSQASEAAQRAFFAALDGAISAPVLDEPGENPAFPYVTIGDAIETARNTMGRTGRNVLAQVDVWSRSGSDFGQDGYGEAKRIAGEIDSVLDDATPADTDGWSFVSVAFETSQYVRDPDGITRHGILQYRVFVEAA